MTRWKRNFYRMGLAAFWGALGYLIFLVIAFSKGVISPLYQLTIGGNSIIFSRWWDVLLFPAYLVLMAGVYMSFVPSLKKKKRSDEIYYWTWFPVVIVAVILLFGILADIQFNVNIVNPIGALVLGAVIGATGVLIADLNLAVLGGITTGFSLGLALGITSGLAVGFKMFVCVFCGMAIGACISIIINIAIIVIHAGSCLVVLLHEKAFERITEKVTTKTGKT